MKYIQSFYVTGNRTKARLALPSQIKEVGVFLVRLVNVLAENDFDANDVFAVRLAVEEALINAIKHGNKMDQAKKVHLRIAIGSGVFRIQIRDEGSGFEPAAVPV